MATILG